MARRTLLTLIAAAVSVAGWSQAFIKPYEDGVASLKAGHWAQARERFDLAAQHKQDAAGPIYLPGSIMDRKVWRGGAAYSPTFLAAYAGYREAADGASARSALLGDAETRLKFLLDSGRQSVAAYFLLARVYDLAASPETKQALTDRFATEGHLATFRVDLGVLPVEDATAIQSVPRPSKPRVERSQGRVAPTESQPTVEAGTQAQTAVPAAQPLLAPPAAQAPTVSSAPAQAAVSLDGPPVAMGAQKYALVIGNALSATPEADLPFAADDAVRVKDALVRFAGYPEANIDLVQNATAEQMAASIRAMAERVSEGASVLIFYTGAGSNLGGRDYLAGVDAEFPSDQAHMLPKADVYRIFTERGAVVFGFFQAHRPIDSGRYFGAEVPSVGRFAQAQATIPGARVQGIYAGGRLTGLYTEAFVDVLSKARSTQIPILEFGWMLFNQIRRGDTGSTGGSSQQVPTLPVLTNLASDARF